MGNLIRIITTDGAILCTVIDGTQISAEGERMHQTSAVVTAALGRLMMGASMIGASLKNQEDSVTIRLAGNGPTGTLIVVSDSKGNPRGYVANPIVEIPLNSYGKLDVAGAVGKEGTLTVIKDVGYPDPVSGTVPIVSGEIAEDLTCYFATSEQIPTVCALGVLVNPDLTVRAAGGFLIQLLPGVPETAIKQVENNLKEIDPVSTMVDQGMSPEMIAARLLEGFSYEVMETRDVAYRCDCSRKRVERALLSLGREELNRLADEQETTEVCCHFCNRKYVFQREEILAFAQR